MTDPDRLADFNQLPIIKDLWRRYEVDPQGTDWEQSDLLWRVPWLVAEIERLRGRLRDLEWVGGPNTPGLCPVCLRPGGGHDLDCWLAAEIRSD